MKNTTLIIILILFVSGCKSLKTKTDIETSKITRSELFKKADTLKYTVPKAVYKDTTIYVRNFDNPSSNTLKIIYDKNGNESQIDCMSDAVKEFKETIETMKEQSKIKDTEIQIPFGLIILYVFIGLGALLVLNKVTNKFI